MSSAKAPSPQAPEAPEAPAAAAPPGAPTSKLVLILLILNLGASGFGAFKLLTAHPVAAAAAAPGAAHKGDAKGGHETSEVSGPIIELEPFVVNLDEPGTARYLRAKVQLEVADAAAGASVTKSVLLVRDIILGHLSGLKHADTLGSQAKESVRTEMMKKLEAQLGGKKIKRMFFTEWVVQ